MTGLPAIAHVAAGRDASYAVATDGRVFAWGSNALGEVGDGTTQRRLRPVPVLGLPPTIVEVAPGRNHVLAVSSSGALWAWGDNAYGQVGDGTTQRRLAPVPVLGSGIMHVEAGAHHSIAVRSDGVVLTWGRGYRGQLGIGTTSNRSTPVAVSGLPSIVDVGDGRDQSFAITATGNVWAWGFNNAGQLGDGTTTRRLRPVSLGTSGVQTVQSGAEHTVFLT